VHLDEGNNARVVAEGQPRAIGVDSNAEKRMGHRQSEYLARGV
jgi:hypothetical protein